MISYNTLTENVLKKYITEIFIETGTYLGDSVNLALRLGFNKVISVEINKDLYDANINKFKSEIYNGKVELYNGDSLLVLDEIISKLDKKTTFWLDAHYDFGISGLKKCPLYEELLSIKKSKINDHIILIDDVRCFGNGNWGEGISLNGVIEHIMSINSDYIIEFENGIVPNDILVAKIK